MTAVELLPIHAFLQDHFLVERGLRNYWGYSTLAFFAPEPAYLSTPTLHEMKVAIRRLHGAGIEVLLDVVFNHTCEGNELGPTLSFRGWTTRATTGWCQARSATTSTTLAAAIRSTCRTRACCRW